MKRQDTLAAGSGGAASPDLDAHAARDDDSAPWGYLVGECGHPVPIGLDCLVGECRVCDASRPPVADMRLPATELYTIMMASVDTVSCVTIAGPSTRYVLPAVGQELVDQVTNVSRARGELVDQAHVATVEPRLDVSGRDLQLVEPAVVPAVVVEAVRDHHDSHRHRLRRARVRKAGADEMAGFGLVQPPPAGVLQPVIMPTDRSGVGFRGRPAIAVVHGVVEIGAACRAAAARVHAKPISDFDMAAQRRPGESSSGFLGV